MGGIAKGMIQTSGQPIIMGLIDHLASRCDDVFLVGRSRPEYKTLKIPIFADVMTNRGSPGGVYSAMQHARHDHVLVVACDMPAVDGASLDALLQHPLDADARPSFDRAAAVHELPLAVLRPLQPPSCDHEPPQRSCHAESAAPPRPSSLLQWEWCLPMRAA